MLSKKIPIFFKYQSFLLALSAIFVIGCSLFYFKSTEAFKYFHSNCNIYDRSGHVVQSIPGYQFCSYHPQGMILAINSKENKMTLFDKNDAVVWTTSELAHHDIKFSNDLSFIYTFLSATENKNNQIVRSDCVSKRDYKNKILSEWCVKDHLKELKALGFDLKAQSTPFQNWIQLHFDSEISHANSIYEIDDNESAKLNSAFSKGNFIVNLYGPSKAVIILDYRLEKIVWSKNFSDYFCNKCSVLSHDLQVLKNGNILAYINLIEYPITQSVKNFYRLFQLNLGLFYFQIYKPRNYTHSFLAEINPISNNIVWQHEENPESNFRTFINGSVTKIGDHYAYSNNTFGGHMVEITSSGKIIAVIENSKLDNRRNIPIEFTKPKPFLDNFFLKSRNLTD